MRGWDGNRDAVSCLDNYFNNIQSDMEVMAEMHAIYSKLNDMNAQPFLWVLKHQLGKRDGCRDEIKDMAYEIISTQSLTDNSIITELRYFNKADKHIVKDTLRFKLNNKKQK